LRPVCHATAGVVATARPQGFCESEWPAPAGEIGSGCFEAADVIRVRRGHVSVPTAGSVLPGGNTTEVRWDTPADVDVPSVVVPFSADDGASWNLMARDLPNTGSYLWTVPTTATDRAGIAVVTMSFGEGGREVVGVIGVSARFAISSVLAVGSENARFALRGAVPNPGRGLVVSFSLANAEPARLAVYDVSGRQVMARPVGWLGAGRHLVTLREAGKLAPGVYLVNLIHGDQRLVARAVVLR
jgi:hypothetical protein